MAAFKELNSIDQLDQVFAASAETPVVIFKHSTTCPISVGVYEEVSRFPGTVHLVVVQTARPVSSEIAERTGVRHESPQALVLRDGIAVYSASHYDVTAADIGTHFDS